AQNYRPSEAATHLGIDTRLLGRWVMESKQQTAGQSFRGNGTLTAEQQQIRELKARLKRLEMATC
ncbi:MAG: IS3 family transposase, partial [Candidatus Competibacteraceae bacterium]|nr:IS3 family transposase [Candidatus Competibacteraceae bacterium]